MSVGKYSPTVTSSYMNNQDWFTQHCEDPDAMYDRDGYDSYGYSVDGYDRAGKTEDNYLSGNYDPDTDEFLGYWTYEIVADGWRGVMIPSQMATNLSQAD